MMIFRRSFMYPKPPQTLRQSLVIRREHSTITSAPEILGRIKTETADQADGTSPESTVFSSNGLRRIFNQWQAMPLADFEERYHVRTLTIQMDGHNYARPRSYCCLY